MVGLGSGWDWHTFSFTDTHNFTATLDPATIRLGPVLNATNPDLSAFKGLGGKLLMYHGWADQNIAPRNSIAYYNSVVDSMGSVADTQGFLRLFMAPGMGIAEVARVPTPSIRSQRLSSGWKRAPHRPGSPHRTRRVVWWIARVHSAHIPRLPHTRGVAA